MQRYMNQATTRLGTFLSLGSATLAELCADLSMDWVLIDLEHGCQSEASLPEQLRALRGSNTLGVVRVANLQDGLIGRALDWGAAGIMLSHVDDRGKAEALVQQACYPPRGQRGVSRTVRAHAHGLRLPADFRTAAPPLLLAQIESFQAVEAAAEIAAVDGIDALFVGPADLSHSLSLEQHNPGYEACLDRVIEAARLTGKGWGILARHADDLRALLAREPRWLALDSDLSLLREAWRSRLEALRQPARGSKP
jgi:2-dehydro-3-deoxyglucarate aldolase/4-hydroxy-2-oxoheptanedioate aldolase